MLDAGERPSWVAAMLGHTSVETTFRHYHRFIKDLTGRDGAAFMAQWEKAGNG